PLFSLFSAEVRQIIFAHALVEYDDLSRPYNKHESYYSADFKFAGKITLDLLLTCRQIYLEARLFPILVNDHIFWQGGAPLGLYVANSAAYFARMSSEQRALVRRAHFIADLAWLRRQADSVVWPAGIALRKLKISVRHHGWEYRWDNDWYEEGGGTLYIRNLAKCWGGWIKNTPSLQVLEVELESERGQQLVAQASKARRWRFPLADG
ncbi:hypothetical protein DFH07DRAFT_712996, partial [Mycena maculata]